jgi:multidrug efflux pump subunit AcrA (membrane-fusion protein)
MKLFLLIFLSFSALYANVYYSKVEPYEIKKISSNVIGVVDVVDENLLGVKLSNKAYITIDSQLDKDELKYTNEKLKYSKATLIVNEEILNNLKMSVIKKRDNYKKVQAMKIKSLVEKDREFYDLVASENSFLSTQKELNSLKTQIADLELRKAQLIRSISDKTLKNSGYTLYSLDVKEGQVVNKGTPLATVVDTNRALLTIYLNFEDVANAKSKVVYINGQKTSYKIDRLLNIADSKNISKYMAQIVIKAPKIFSKLVKIELRDK